MKIFSNEKRKPRTGEFFSAKYFVARAIALMVLFLIVHLAGLREYTAFLSGTAANPAIGMQTSAFYGMAYIVFYVGAIVAAPILVIAAGILVGWQKFRERRRVTVVETPRQAAIASGQA